ncbi:MAG: TIGR01777 family protein [Deltaproteobacteria bacterium]|nr:TIGR01777 family protein [Deltaproteobacteria bacterium]
MRILITGATGLIGQQLVDQLGSSHQLVAWVRDIDRARTSLGQGVELFSQPGELDQRVQHADAIVNLAGAPIAGQRWTSRYKRQLRDSRIDTTTRIARCCAASKTPLLISASAVGIYGDQADRLLDESAPTGDDFLAELCRDWERAASQAEPHTRVVLLRTGVVLAREGGALQKMLPAFRRGLGGPLGSGRQYMPWIHIADMVAAISFAIENTSLSGPLNCVAPNPCTSAEFAAELGKQLRRSARLRVFSPLLKLAVGELSAALLSSQRAIPAALAGQGFRFRYPQLTDALTALLST